MTEQHLDDAQVGAGFEAVGGKRMAQGVGRDPFGDATVSERDAQRGLHALGAHGLAGRAAGEQIGLGGLLGAIVVAQGVEQDRAQHGVAVAPALAGADVEHHTLGVDVADAEMAGFGDPQSGPVGAEQHHAVFRLPQSAEDLGHFARARDVEQDPGDLRVRDLLDHLGAVQGDGVEELEGGHLHLRLAGL